MRHQWHRHSASHVDIRVGDCLEILKLLPSNSVDAIVTDPPAGIGFMGKQWDRDKGGRRQWIAWLAERMRECLRVLKPGGHALVWSLPRTSHWTGTALEEAGFEIRDRLSHFFGTGFPKNHDISKAIDRTLGIHPTDDGENPNHRPVSGVSYQGVYAGGNTGAARSTKATSDEARKWEGYGTALKPACEDWWLVRKPLEGTIARNILDYGTGALNIDGCRITTDDKLQRKLGTSTESASGWKSTNRSEITGKDGGRWPAHIMFDEEAAAVLDDQSGKLTTGAKTGRRNVAKFRQVYGEFKGYNEKPTPASSGGASRFFYVAKGPRKEKESGLDNFNVRDGGEATGRVGGHAGLNSPRAGAGRGGGVRNTHPTIKSVNLMCWLVRLVTPPGGTVLDPFTGSGTTGMACAYEGVQFLGIELDCDYATLAAARIRYAIDDARREDDK